MRVHEAREDAVHHAETLGHAEIAAAAREEASRVAALRMLEDEERAARHLDDFDEAHDVGVAQLRRAAS